MRLILNTLLLFFSSISMQAQTVIDMAIRQNAPFSVSTNDVTVVLDQTSVTLGADLVVTGGQGPLEYTWSVGGETLSNQSTFTADKAGDYRLDITDVCECEQTVIFHVTLAEGIADAATVTPLAHYSGGVVTLDDAASIAQATLMAADGRVVRVATNHDNTLRTMSLYDMPAGQYILTLRLRDGGVQVFKFLSIK